MHEEHRALYVYKGEHNKATKLITTTNGFVTSATGLITSALMKDNALYFFSDLSSLKSGTGSIVGADQPPCSPWSVS